MPKSLFLYILCFAFVLIGCTTTATTKPHQASHAIKQGESRISYLTPKHRAKAGNDIVFYSEKSYLKRPYRIIGKETVSRYNFIGLERRTRTVDEIMKNLAASMGGDAVINITADSQKVEGTVISFEKVMYLFG